MSEQTPDPQGQQAVHVEISRFDQPSAAVEEAARRAQNQLVHDDHARQVIQDHAPGGTQDTAQLPVQNLPISRDHQ